MAWLGEPEVHGPRETNEDPAPLQVKEVCLEDPGGAQAEEDQAFIEAISESADG